MKIASLKEGGRDGTLVVVSRDLSQAAKVTEIAPTLRVALDDWAHIASHLQSAYELLNEGKLSTAFALDTAALAAPLPRAAVPFVRSRHQDSALVRKAPGRLQDPPVMASAAR